MISDDARKTAERFPKVSRMRLDPGAILDLLFRALGFPRARIQRPAARKPARRALPLFLGFQWQTWQWEDNGLNTTGPEHQQELIGLLGSLKTFEIHHDTPRWYIYIYICMYTLFAFPFPHGLARGAHPLAFTLDGSGNRR